MRPADLSPWSAGRECRAIAGAPVRRTAADGALPTQAQRRPLAGRHLLEGRDRRPAGRAPVRGTNPAAGRVLIVWAKGDRALPPEHGRRLAGLLPEAQLIEIDDSYAFIPLDPPAGPPSSSPTSPAHRAAPRDHTRTSPGHEHTYSRITRRLPPALPRGPPPGDPARPASKKNRRFSGWLLSGYLPPIWQPADAHRST
jgi:hypothetical protein